MSKRPTKSERLIKRLREELNLPIPESAKIKRVYAGHWQRSSGSWVWEINNWIGSQWSVTRLLKEPKLSASRSSGFSGYGDISIYPESAK